MGESLTYDPKLPHIAVCPSAGMAHIVPYLPLSSMLSSLNCRVTLMTIHPTISTAETTQISSFLASHPHINSLKVELPSLETTVNNQDIGETITSKSSPDPFFVRYNAISNSAHLIAHNLIELQPTAILCDFMFLKGFHQAALGHLGIPIYLFPICSTKFFTLTAYMGQFGELPFSNNGENENENENEDEDFVLAPNMSPIPKSCIPPAFFNPNHIHTKLVVSNSYWVSKCKGIVVNSFDFLEHDTLSALGEGKALSYVPPVFSIGPLKSLHEFTSKNEKGVDHSYLTWLDEKPAKSVVYVNFGSRTPMTKEQTRELGEGLEMSGVRYLWVVKTTVVDNDDKEDLMSFLGESLMDKINENKRGLVLKQWVDQDSVLSHPSVGAFVTHGGWNSGTEAAQRGLPLLLWPLHGDQRLNAHVMEKVGLGIWENGWGWLGERVVKREEIATKVKEVMMNERLRESAKRIGEEASKAWGVNGTSTLMMAKLIEEMSCNAGANLGIH